VGAGKTIVHDITFAVVKNYMNNCKAKGQFDMANEEGEIMGFWLVSNLGFDSYCKHIKKTCERDNCKPKMYFSDTYPNNKTEMEEAMGATIEGRLGLFHYIHRMMETLNKHFHHYSEVVTPFFGLPPRKNHYQGINQRRQQSEPII